MQKNTISRKIATLGIFLAITIVLSYIESLFPPLPGVPPNIKIGLSNIVVMYSVFFIGGKSAITLAILKSAFVLFRGPIAGFISFCGGISSVLMLILLTFLFKDKVSYLILSILGAITHNIGQIGGAMVVLEIPNAWILLPYLVIGGVISGSITSLLLKVTIPAFHQFTKKESKK